MARSNGIYTGRLWFILLFALWFNLHCGLAVRFDPKRKRSKSSSKPSRGRGRDRHASRSKRRFSSLETSKLQPAGGLQTFGATSVNAGEFKPRSLRIVTYNLLASPYMRPEPEKEAVADARMQAQQALLQSTEADVLCLQEFWTNNEKQVLNWADWAERHNYTMYTFPRSLARPRKEDGCATLVRASLAPRHATGFTYNDKGFRVALEVTLLNGMRVFNTHWTFNHHKRDAKQRLHQARKLVQYIDETSNGDTVVVAGDLNGNADEPAVQKLASAGFTLMSAFNTSHPEPFESHKAHTGELLGCDFIAARGNSKFLSWSTLMKTNDMLKEGRLSDHLPVASDLALLEDQVHETTPEPIPEAALETTLEPTEPIPEPTDRPRPETDAAWEIPGVEEKSGEEEHGALQEETNGNEQGSEVFPFAEHGNMRDGLNVTSDSSKQHFDGDLPVETPAK